MLVLSESQAIVQTLETVHAPPWETLTHLKIYTPDYQPLSWVQVWQAFVEVYPERWAIELYPPVEYVPLASLNLANKYRW